MSKALFQNLKKIGVDEATAYEVSGAMNTERYATRQDLVEAIGAIDKSVAAHREETQKSISAHREETQKNILALRDSMVAIRESIAAHREETQKNISASNRQLWILFGTTIVTLIALSITLLVGTWHSRPPQLSHWPGGSAELKQPTPPPSKGGG